MIPFQQWRRSLKKGVPAAERLLFCFAPDTLHDRQGVTALSGNGQALPFKCLYRIAIGSGGSYDLIILQPAQNGVAAEQVSFELVAVFHVPEKILFSLGEFRHNPNATSFAAVGEEVYPLAGKFLTGRSAIAR